MKARDGLLYGIILVALGVVLYGFSGVVVTVYSVAADSLDIL